MKVLTIREPFASLIKNRVKCIETRSWKTNYRGEIYIHAGKNKVDFNDNRIKKLLKYIPNEKMQYGKIICKCNLIDCIYMDSDYIDMISKNKKEYLCGRYEPGRYAWVLEIVSILEVPIEAKGQLGIWNFKD